MSATIEQGRFGNMDICDGMSVLQVLTPEELTKYHAHILAGLNWYDNEASEAEKWAVLKTHHDLLTVYLNRSAINKVNFSDFYFESFERYFDCRLDVFQKTQVKNMLNFVEAKAWLNQFLRYNESNLEDLSNWDEPLFYIDDCNSIEPSIDWTLVAIKEDNSSASSELTSDPVVFNLTGGQ